MNLQSITTKLKSEIESARGQDYNLSLDPELVLKLCKIAEVQDEGLAFYNECKYGVTAKNAIERVKIIARRGWE